MVIQIDLKVTQIVLKELDMWIKSDPKGIAEAVSPVIAVMLMLVVTIIIAAVVSGYSGGLVKGQDSAPSAAIDVTIKNTGEWKGSFIQFDVKSVNEPFPSGDLKIITSWTNSTGGGGGNTTMKGLNAPNTKYGTSVYYQSPLGYGPSITKWDIMPNTSYTGGFPAEQQFGNYTLTVGATMKATAYGETLANGGYGVNTLFNYTDGAVYKWASNADGMQAVLGKYWYTLRTGDVVRVSIMHVPSGKNVYSKNIAVV